MPTRRAFLIAGSTFAVGSALGGACGYSLGTSKTAAPAADAQPSSGNVELDELRRLAVKAPIAELVEQGVFFLHKRDTAYPRDEVLWKGVERLARAITEGSTEVGRPLLLVVTATIERGGPPADLRLDAYLPALHKLRSSRNR